MKRSILIALALAVSAGAGSASAQGFLSPFIGTTLSSPSPNGSTTKPGYGIQFGALGKVVGFDTEIAYFPEVLDNAANGLSKSRVFSFSGNTLIGPMLGGVKPYFAFGFGNLNLNVTGVKSIVVPTVESVSNNYFTFNTGGGVVGFFSKHFGVRGDLRYTRAFGIKFEDLETTGLALDKFNFWRGTIGLAVKF